MGTQEAVAPLSNEVDWSKINPNEIPLSVLTKNTLIHELMESRDLESEVKLPYVVQNKILMSPGVWNGVPWTPDTIKHTFEMTNWEDKDVRTLFLDHRDREAGVWVGEVVNPRLLDNGIIMGDLVIVDKQTAMNIHYGAHIGISPKVKGVRIGSNSALEAFQFKNFSVVKDPAIKTAYINNSEGAPVIEGEVEQPETNTQPREEENMADNTTAPATPSMSEAEIAALVKDTNFSAFAANYPNKEASLVEMREAYVESKKKAEQAQTIEAIVAKAVAEAYAKQAATPAPAPVAAPSAPAIVEMSEVKALEEKIAALEAKLATPAPATQRIEAPANPTIVEMSAADRNIGFLNFLKSKTSGL